MKKSKKLFLRELLVVALAFWTMAMTSSPTAYAADAFDRITAEARYRDWYQRFEADYREFAKAVANLDRKNARNRETIDILTAKINASFAHSVIPDSRMTQWLVAMSLNDSTFVDDPKSDPEIRGTGTRTLELLRGALPVGYGGHYHKASPTPGDEDSFVWYIRPHLNESASSWFDESFHLPPYGVMERKAYPFFNFLEKDGKLFLTAFSAEFSWVLVHVYNAE